MSKLAKNLVRMAVWLAQTNRKGRLFSDGLFYLGIEFLGVKGEVL